MIIMTNKRFDERISRNVRLELGRLLQDENMSRKIAMDYLVGLQAKHLRIFNEAVGLRRDSEARLKKLDEVEPDIDKAMEETQFLEDMGEIDNMLGKPEKEKKFVSVRPNSELGDMK